MKTHIIQAGDSFESLAGKFKVKDSGFLKTFHNLNCPEEDIMQEPVAGKGILIPEDPQYLTENKESNLSGRFDEEPKETSQESESNHSSTIQKKEEKQSKNKSSEHDGKYFVIQKGMCQCNQGFKFPKFKVSSHKKHYWNDADGQDDYLAVTEDDLILDPPTMPFGNCKLKPSSSGYLPCSYAPAGKWTKTYDKVKVMGKSCVTELSELMCATGGKITVMKHGQQSEAGKSNVKNADVREQNVYNPIMNFEEFQEEVNDNNQDAY